MISVLTNLLIPAAAPSLAPISARQNMLILSASSCASALVVILGSTVFVKVDVIAVAVFEEFSTDERVTSLVDKMAFKELAVAASNPFMPSLELS